MRPFPETHILLECDLTRAPRQVMLNSIRNVLLKEQVFSLSQLNRLSQAAWKRILLFGHAELNRPSSCNYTTQFVIFFQQL